MEECEAKYMDVWNLYYLILNSYIQNLPDDVNEEILNDVFKRYGIIQQNMDGTPRVYFENYNKKQIRLYRDENGKLKGDASICYLRKESIQLAIQMHDDAPLRYSYYFKIIYNKQRYTTYSCF